MRLPVKIDRLVSLAPSLTEIVYAIGAGKHLVGDTSYCDYPAEARSVTKVGDTMHPSIEQIIALKPQVVLVSTASQLEGFTRQLDEQRIAVYVTNPQDLEQLFHSLETLGDLLGTGDQARKLASDLRQRTVAVESAVKGTNRVRVFYQVSGEPLYTIGREAYLTDLIRRAGGESVTADVRTAFPRYSDEAALAARFGVSNTMDAYFGAVFIPNVQRVYVARNPTYFHYFYSTANVPAMLRALVA